MFPDGGLFVCFEGGEGAGKSTQSRLLADALSARGRDVVLTREPGGTPAGKCIREILLDPATGDLSPRAEALLYAADRAHHVDAVIRPALERGAVVITDRYIDSTLAYQGAGRLLDVTEIEGISRWASGDLRPNLTVLLDLAPEEGMSRFAERDRIEAAGVEFHQRVRLGFLDRAAADPDRYLVLNARAEVDFLAAEVLERVEGLLA